mgnify:CR=1 FL=1
MKTEIFKRIFQLMNLNFILCFYLVHLNCHVWLGIDLSHELLMNIARFLAHAKEKNIGITTHSMHCMHVHLWSKHIAAVRTAA